ncbi:DUF3307 domain-containing protein [Salinispora oceanensis]|uniref:DUF3307 domain-containing protein n=1 Tax=Salinispora oceanensis TaxID=1050199 RepID=UPI000376ACFA|nr:DUF3307 domain-containing protein [Salinispora oceanensis]
MTAAAFAAIFAALYAAHTVADHWVQTQHQADHKGCDPHHGGTAHPHCTVWRSRWHCTAHVLTYTATALSAVLVVAWQCGIDLRPGHLVLALTVSAVSHYIADRRTPLRWLADRTGSGRFYTVGAPRPGRDDNPSIGTGAYALDQSWHTGWILVAALIAV